MTTISPGSKLRREIRIPGINVPVSVEITATGLYFFVKGSRKRCWLPWVTALEASITPEDIKSFLVGKPLAMLQAQAAKQKERTTD